MAYNFASEAYTSCITPSADVDTTHLRANAVQKVRAFDAASWAEDPVTTMLGQELLRDAADTLVDTLDAFGAANGKMRLAPRGIVDRMLAHMQGFKPKVTDLREAVRAIEDRFFNPEGELAAMLVANQALDFHKQDGFTEIEETNQAMLVERRMNDALLADEAAGILTVGRATAIVGAVSNFSHFLDLCRKILRNLECGVPVVVFSRSNTTQHMYRYYLVLADLLAQHGIESGMVAYLACSVEEQRRVLAACPEHPMYFTGSRGIAERIREVAPRLMASTGGPNTMVAESLTDAVADAARMSNLIEHKGQCTAMRHLVVPGATEADLTGKVYSLGDGCLTPAAAASMEAGSFFGIMQGQPLKQPLPAGYKTLPGALKDHVAFRLNSSLPVAIEERWREAYLDVTAPPRLDEALLAELATWCRREQPITLALNCEPAAAKQLFETTSLVVYTVGHPVERPALTCQARPQEGEVFGEVPPRRVMGRHTRFPVVVPTSTPGYNSCYTQHFLVAQGKAPFAKWGLPQALSKIAPAVQRIEDPARRGFCRQLLGYLADAAVGPRRGVGARTTLFGLQRPPLGTKVCLRLEKLADGSAAHEDRLYDEAAPFILPFLATNAKSQLRVSLDPLLTFPAYPMLQEQGIEIAREESLAFEADQGAFWNVVRLPAQALQEEEHPLVAHFVSLLMAFGHVKSTQSDDRAFLDCFAASEKWLRCIGPAAKL